MRVVSCFIVALFVFIALCLPMAHAANWTRSGNVEEKEWHESSGKPLVFGVLVQPPPNNNNCDGGDLAVKFDISIFANIAGSAFDVNKIYVDGIWTGEAALDVWLTHWWFNGYGRKLVALGDDPYDWKNQSSIFVCVGSTVQNGTSPNALQSIVLWYDGDVSTTIIHKPRDEPHNENSPKNTANVDDSLVISGNGLAARDTRGTPPSGSSAQSISGPRVDLKPDFDVYNTSNQEISANCNNCMGKSVDVGQIIKPKLWVEVDNEDADHFKRDGDSDTLEGPIWWKIEGKTGWNLLASGEYTISKLDDGEKISETHTWTVPNYPGDILAMKACVDGDDEI